MLQFGEAIGGVDGDEDQARYGRTELGDHPFCIVLREDGDAVPWLQPHLLETGGKPFCIAI